MCLLKKILHNFPLDSSVTQQIKSEFITFVVYWSFVSWTRDSLTNMSRYMHGWTTLLSWDIHSCCFLPLFDYLKQLYEAKQSWSMYFERERNANMISCRWHAYNSKPSTKITAFIYDQDQIAALRHDDWGLDAYQLQQYKISCWGHATSANCWGSTL